MSNYMVNAAPMVINLGTNDLSTVQTARVPDTFPQHLAKVFFYAEQGPTVPQMVSGAEAVNMFGQATFDERSSFANHATVLTNNIIGAGGSIMAQRIIPNDAGPNSTVVLYLDVLETTVARYQKDDTGAVTLDVSGNPITADAGVTGYKVKWVLGTHATVNDLNTNFGILSSSAGDQTDSGTHVQSTKYPIFEFQVSSQGAYGNNLGLCFWAPTLPQAGQMPTTMMNELRAYPYRFSMIKRATASGSAVTVNTILGDQSLQVTLLPNSIDPTTDSQLYVGDVLLDSYQNLTDPLYPPVYGNFSKMAIYQANIDHLLGLFYASELPQIDAFSDITTNPNDKYLINIASFVSSHNSPYNSINVVSSNNSVSMSQYTNIYARSGSDGTMNNAAFAASVTAKMADYLDPNNSIQEKAINIESIIYDSGFPIATKEALINFIAVRTDTFVILSTYDVDQPNRSEAEENSIAVSLRTRLLMCPESSLFGTPVMRGLIMGRSGTLRNSFHKAPLPLTFEIAIKSTQYMGAGNGKWTNGKNFDGAPGSVLTYMTNPSISWVPTTVRNKNWAIGLNWVQAYDRKSFFFPALKTVYDDDTSVLNSYFTALAICTLNKITDAVWRDFSGVSNLTNAQLVERVNASVSAKVQGIFDDRFIIVPKAVVTQADAKNGFSWTLPVDIYAPSMETVMTTYIRGFRMDSYSGK